MFYDNNFDYLFDADDAEQQSLIFYTLSTADQEIYNNLMSEGMDIEEIEYLFQQESL